MHFVSLFYPKIEGEESFYSFPVLFPSIEVSGVKNFFRLHLSEFGDDELQSFIKDSIARGVEIHSIALFNSSNTTTPVITGAPIKLCNLVDIFEESEVVSNVDTQSV